VNLLTPGDRLSPAWIKLQQYYAERLETLRSKNDNALTADETARLRGQIAEVKALLAFGEDIQIVIDE